MNATQAAKAIKRFKECDKERIQKGRECQNLADDLRSKIWQHLRIDDVLKDDIADTIADYKNLCRPGKPDSTIESLIGAYRSAVQEYKKLSDESEELRASLTAWAKKEGPLRDAELESAYKKHFEAALRAITPYFEDANEASEYAADFPKIRDLRFRRCAWLRATCNGPSSVAPASTLLRELATEVKL